MPPFPVVSGLDLPKDRVRCVRARVPVVLHDQLERQDRDKALRDRVAVTIALAVRAGQHAMRPRRGPVRRRRSCSGASRATGTPVAAAFRSRRTQARSWSGRTSSRRRICASETLAERRDVSSGATSVLVSALKTRRSRRPVLLLDAMHHLPTQSRASEASANSGQVQTTRSIALPESMCVDGRSPA